MKNRRNHNALPESLFCTHATMCKWSLMRSHGEVNSGDRPIGRYRNADGSKRRGVSQTH